MPVFGKMSFWKIIFDSFPSQLKRCPTEIFKWCTGENYSLGSTRQRKFLFYSKPDALHFASILHQNKVQGRDTLERHSPAPIYLPDRRRNKELPQKTSPKLRDLIRFEVSLCFVWRKVSLERLEEKTYLITPNNMPLRKV